MSSIYIWEEYDMYLSPQRISEVPEHQTARLWPPKTLEQLNKGSAASKKRIQIIKRDLSAVKSLRKMVAEFTHAKGDMQDQDLYDRSGVARQTWRNIKMLYCVPTVPIIRKLCTALGLDFLHVCHLRESALQEIEAQGNNFPKIPARYH